MYDLLILGSLLSGDKTGYKLQKIVGASLQPMRKVSSGALYPSLEKLENDQLVTAVVREEGRKLKFWHITEKGVDRFVTLMKTRIPSDAKRNDMIHFKLRSLDSVSLEDQVAILNEFREFIINDLDFYQEKKQEMAENIKKIPEHASRFEVLVASYELDIQIAQTKLVWIDNQLTLRMQ
ncbi:MAG: PadR family transcriptional regulator [Enterococcus sp.]